MTVKVKPLYLEERVWIARRALDETAPYFRDLLPKEARGDFANFISATMGVLQGDDFGFDQKYLRRLLKKLEKRSLKSSRRR